MKVSTKARSPSGRRRLKAEMKCDTMGSFGIQCSGVWLVSNCTLRGRSTTSPGSVGTTCTPVVSVVLRTMMSDLLLATD
ncbi:Uncharacterised protein [Mycobacteroides abscessus subsp. abscessus]|nr:Uncharacterised protein [Mycobacteroides abscessus subsp. abscessus]